MLILWLGITFFTLIFMVFILINGFNKDFLTKRLNFSVPKVNSVFSDNALKAIKDDHQHTLTSLKVNLCLLALSLCVIAILMYCYLGSALNLALFQARLEVALSKTPDTKHFILRFEKAAQRFPNQVAVWSILYPLYQDNHQLNQSLYALQQWQRLEPRNPQVLAELVLLTYHLAGNQRDESVEKWIRLLQQIDPMHPGLQLLLGLEAFQTQHFQKAIGYWRKALTRTQDPATLNRLNQMIEATQRRLALQENESLP